MKATTILRHEAALKVTGKAVYEGETRADGMLHAALVSTPIGCGQILSIDGTQAQREPGFADLVSYEQTASLKPSSATKLIRERTVHFPGQPVALVCAQTLRAAQAAARAVQVTSQASLAVTAMAQARDRAVAPALVGRYPASSSRGNAAAALLQSQLVIRQRYQTATNNHHPLEPHAVVCFWQGETVTVHTNAQGVAGTRGIIAHAFSMPAENVRVITRYLGGGFGCKGQLWWPWMLLAILSSKRTGRPVRLELSRAQLFTLVGRRQETEQDVALGFDNDGSLNAIEHHVLAQTATHGDYSDTTAGVSRWLYACPNVSTSHRLVRTNEPQPIPMRAPGHAPGTFAVESAMDEAAHLLGIDPVALRVRNFADHDQDANRPWTSNGLLECYRIGAERFNWAQRPPSGQAIDGRWRLGYGMASTFYPQHAQPCKARVSLNADASVLVECGTQDMGSGTYTVLAQLAAQALGIPMSAVHVAIGDSALPQGPASAGSQATLSVVPALQSATAQLCAQLAALAASDPRSPLVGQRAEDISFEGGQIRNKEISESLTALLARCAASGLQAEGESAAWEAGAFSAMGYGAVFVEVGVDPQLGEVRVRRVCAAFAAGRILNPLLARSQYVGGLIGGIGMALHERTVTDRASGHIVGDNFADYLIPVHADMPSFDIALVSEDDQHLPGGIKGVGMLGSAGVQAAIANAIFNAVGRRIRHLPIRIEDVMGL